MQAQSVHHQQTHVNGKYDPTIGHCRYDLAECGLSLANSHKQRGYTVVKGPHQSPDEATFHHRPGRQLSIISTS